MTIFRDDFQISSLRSQNLPGGHTMQPTNIVGNLRLTLADKKFTCQQLSGFHGARCEISGVACQYQGAFDAA